MKIYGYSHRNIGPYGNIATVVNFENKAAMNMMIADNGVGKTTMISVLKYGLYHDLAYAGDVKVDEIANDINKNGEIIVELNSRGKDWTIITNFSPNKIKIYEGRGAERSHEPLDKGGLPETKKFIRDQVLDIPFYIFDNILSIDVSEFKSLLTLNAEDNRKIRDRVFGFSIFNDMSTEIKKELNNLIEERKMADYDLVQLNEQHTKLLHDIEDMKNQVKSELKVDDLKEQIIKINEQKEAIGSTIDQIKRQLVIATSDVNHYKNKQLKAEIATKRLERDELSNSINNNNGEQHSIDNLINRLMDYSEITKLNASITADKNWYNANIPVFDKAKKDHDANVAKLAELENIRNQIKLEEFEHDLRAKYNEWLTKDRLIKIDREQIIAEEAKIKPLEEQTTQIVNSLQSEINEGNSLISIKTKHLEARKKGECIECGTQFKGETDTAHNTRLESEIIKLKEQNKINFDKITEIKHKNNLAIEELKKGIKLLNDDLQTHLSREAVLKAAFTNSGYTMEKISTIDVTKKTEGNIVILDAQILEIKSSIARENAVVTELRSKLAIIKDKVSKEKAQVAQLITKFPEEPKGDIEALREKRADLMTKRNTMQKSQNDLDVSIQVLQSKIVDAPADPVYTEPDAKKYVDELPAQAEKYRIEEIDLDRKLFEHNKSIEIATNAANLDLQSVHIKRQADEVEGKIKKSKQKVDDLKSKINRKEHMLEVIKRSKDKVLSINIPYINHMVVDICKKIGVPQQLMFDDTFTPHVFRGSREVSLKSASLGQRKKMNFAVLIAITRFLKLRYGGLNIIFYDEMFSSIDEKGRPHMLEIIRQEIVENLGIHVWITNHFFIPNAQFDNYIIIEAKNGFSSARQIEAGELLSLDNYKEKKQEEVAA